MFRRPLVVLTLFSILIGLPGCANRLSGPIHSVDDPPWIAEGILRGVPEIELVHRFLLIGDAGYFLEDDRTLAALHDWATPVETTTVVMLGDNIYNEGLTDDDRERGEQILGQQLAATEARKIVIPGNHDWGFLPKDQNAQSIRNQQAFVDGWPEGHAEFIPKEGCMGPVARILREPSADQKGVVFIALDPTPWINERLREDCPTNRTKEAFLVELDALLTLHSEQFVIVASHYPMLTGGPHGGLTYGFFADMIVTPLGWMMGGLGNTYEPDYADWIERTQEVLRRNPPAIYAAGHDHSLQILDAADVAGAYIVSGAGARDRVSNVTNIEQTRFAHSAPGFVVVDFGRYEGEDIVLLRIIEAGTSDPVFEMRLPKPDRS
jgi:hypothetical protein